MTTGVPKARVVDCNQRPIRSDGLYVLYWMTAFRRVNWNFSLQRAADWSRELKRPLLILEALRCDYPWASDRLHRFVVQGMACNAVRLEGKPVAYHPYVEQERGAGRGLLAALANRACLVVTDEYPCFFLPRMVATAARRLPVRLEKVDSNGLLPLRGAAKTFTRAYDFRRFLQANLAPHLDCFPAADPLSDPLPPAIEPPAEVRARWPAVGRKELDNPAPWLGALPMDHTVAPAPKRGGADAAEEALRTFLRDRLTDYVNLRNHPQEEATSEISPWLHFGHLSAHQVFRELVGQTGGELDGLDRSRLGKVENWWRLGPSAQAFLDQLLTWREIGFNFCHHNPDYKDYESLPGWALKTLAEHAGDPRPDLYTLREFAEARTHDPLWNAAQRQLLVEGRIHNYMRMLWGKKILHWSANPEEALATMIELNDRYALDGRDPNSYSGIFWCLGRYDRAWGPERPIFGKIRYMTSESTARKFNVRGYLRRHGETRAQ